jgi:hypothetical protein
MKNYITKEALPEILEHMAEKFLENEDRISIRFELIKYGQSNPVLEIDIQEQGTWTHLLKQEYEIIEGTKDSYDVAEDTIQEAILKIEKSNKEEN